MSLRRFCAKHMPNIYKYVNLSSSIIYLNNGNNNQRYSNIKHIIVKPVDEFWQATIFVDTSMSFLIILISFYPEKCANSGSKESKTYVFFCTNTVTTIKIGEFGWHRFRNTARKWHTACFGTFKCRR